MKMDTIIHYVKMNHDLLQKIACVTRGASGADTVEDLVPERLRTPQELDSLNKRLQDKAFKEKFVCTCKTSSYNLLLIVDL